MTASKAVRPLEGSGLQDPSALCYNTYLLEVKQHSEVLIWLSEKNFKNSKI